MEHITSIRYSNYKTFRQYSVAIDEFNILVGPNNSGKSTVIGSLKILAEALRKARVRNPVLVEGPNGTVRGYEVDLSNVPVATENIFYNYDDATPAKLTFHLSNGAELKLYFPERDGSVLSPFSPRLRGRIPHDDDSVEGAIVAHQEAVLQVFKA